MRLRISLFILAAALPAWCTTGLAQQRMANTPNWRFVDRGWVRPDRTAKLSQFVTLIEEDGRHLLRRRLDFSVEPMLANYRTAVVELEGNPFAWKASTIGRVWNFNRSASTPQLQLIAAVQDTPLPAGFTLTKVDITPHAGSFQATAIVDEKAVSVIVVLSPQFAELAVSSLGEAKAIVMARAATARDILKQSPVAARKYLIPAMQLLTGGENPLQPGAADVYRAFDLPADANVTAQIERLLPDLAAPAPRQRDAASAALAALGRRGVQAAIGMNLDDIHPEAAARLQAQIDRSAHDPRPADELRGDLTFVIDCTRDVDPRVRVAAESLLRTMK